LRTFPRTGWWISEIGYGMWGIGGWSGSDDDESRAALALAVERGCNFFDTAWAYGNGHSERLLGELLRHRSDRKIYVATKVPPRNRKWPGRASTPVEDVFSYDHILEYTGRSLENLGVSCIDLQQLHVWDDSWTPGDGWKRAVDDLKRQRMIRAFGISVNRWEPSNVLRAIETGLVDAVQVVYNIFDQAPQDALFPACERLGVAIVARVPFDEGSLTGTLTSDARWPEGDWRNVYFAREKLDETLRRVEPLHRVAAGADMTLPELALRFILQHPAVTTTIPGMRRTSHVKENLACSPDGQLPGDVLSALRAQRWDRVPDDCP
jgi:aryl-alcohol dehydrogenase-like predicted oxidoreductase